MKRLRSRLITVTFASLVLAGVLTTSASAAILLVDCWPATVAKNAQATFDFKLIGDVPDEATQYQCWIVVQKPRGKHAEVARYFAGHYTADVWSETLPMQHASATVTLHPGHYQWYVWVENQPDAPCSNSSLRVTRPVRQR